MAPRKPLLSFEMESPTRVYSPVSELGDEGMEVKKKKWYEYLPVIGTVLLVLGPHPSWLYVLIHYHWKILHSLTFFMIHLIVVYTLTFLIYSSMMMCVVRDPGRVTIKETPVNKRGNGDDDDADEMDLNEALMSTEFESFSPGKWCRKCWAPKPERTHHCGACGRCVLKMDHHCPWLGNCIGHQTYPAFVHFLFCITLYASYIAIIMGRAVLYSFNHPNEVDENMPIHALLLCMAGIIFTLVVGSFLIYHVYLITTNQTTLENLSPFLLLRHLPPLPHDRDNRDSHSLSDPPLEPELNYEQRCIVRDAHRAVRLYDIGWRKNWIQVFQTRRKYGWVWRVLCGGGGYGEGKTFPRNEDSDEMLARLADELVRADKTR